MTVKKLIHGGLEDDFLLTFRLWRNIRATKKEKRGGGQMVDKTCMKGLRDLTIHVTYNGRIPETFFPSLWPALKNKNIQMTSP